MDEGRFYISVEKLYRRLGTSAAPLLIDVRRDPAFEADEWMIAGAVRRPPEEIERWGREIPPKHAGLEAGVFRRRNAPLPVGHGDP